MDNETIDYNVPSLEGWREAAGCAEEKIQDIIEDVDEVKESIERLIEAARTCGSWPGTEWKYFEGFERKGESDEEILKFATRVQNNWSSARVLLDQARELMDQAKSIMKKLNEE